MSSVRVPGVLWVILIVVLVYVIRLYAPDYAELSIVIGFVVLKSLNIGTNEVEELLEIIDHLQNQMGRTTMRSAEKGMPYPQLITIDVDEHRPNKIIHWLVG